jgi:hypothetical protein
LFAHVEVRVPLRAHQGFKYFLCVCHVCSSFMFSLRNAVNRLILPL